MECVKLFSEAIPPMEFCCLKACIFEAVRYSYHAMLPMLISSGAVIEATDEIGRTPLMVAASPGYTASIKTLVEVGAKVEKRHQNGRNALSWAAGSKKTDGLSFLLNACNDVESADNEGNGAGIRSILEER